MKFQFQIPLLALLLLTAAMTAGTQESETERFSNSPPERVDRQYRIGYLEGGPYEAYQRHLIEIPLALSRLGWIDTLTIPEPHTDKTTRPLWNWLSDHAGSRYIRFVADAYYTNNWNRERRPVTRRKIIRRFREKGDIDLMISMGTWAGQDLASNDHGVPVIVCSASNAKASGIVKDLEFSGYPHVHAVIDLRYERQIRAFHDVIGFKRLGVIYIDTVDGRSYAAIGAIEKVAAERGFEIVRRHNKGVVGAEEQSLIVCARDLAPEIDAFYISRQTAVNDRTLPKLLKIMHDHGVPTFSQAGESEVRAGAMLSVAERAVRGYAEFHADVIAKTLNGASPGAIPQIYQSPVKFVFNAKTAMNIGMAPDIYNFLVRTAETVYMKSKTGP